MVDFSDMFISFAIYNNIILCKPAIAVAHIITKLLGLYMFSEVAIHKVFNKLAFLKTFK